MLNEYGAECHARWRVNHVNSMSQSIHTETILLKPILHVVQLKPLPFLLTVHSLEIGT